MTPQSAALSRIFPVYYISDYVFSIYFATLLCGIFLLWQLWFRWKIRINCWFCGYDNVIPRYSKIWWKCTTCDQYNGFKKNGDYQKEVPEMYNDLPYTPPKFCANQGQDMKTTNMLCSSCLQNQTYIIEGLKEFEPTDDRYFDEELEQYKAELNMKWDLCVSCRAHVSNYLQDQNQHLVQTYNSNDLNKATDKGLRKLNMKLGSPNTWFFFVYKVFHFLSLLAVIWLWKQQNRLSTTSDAVLFSTCITFVLSTFLLYLYGNTISIVGCFVSFFWTLILMYGNFKTKDSKYLRKASLAVLVFTEVFYLSYLIFCLFINLWKWMTYKQERRERIDRIRESPKVKLEKVGTPPKTNNINELQNPVQLVSDNKPKITLKRKAGNASIPRRPSTPDLLEGHLDAMYIQRKEQTNISPAKDKDTNHVVAALRYSSSPQPPVSHRASGQILRPAMFSFQSSSPKKLPLSLFATPKSKPSSSKEIFSFSQIQISDSQKQASNNEPVRKRKSSVNNIRKPESSVQKVKRVKMADERPPARYCTWFHFFIFVLVFSLVCNFLLACKVSSIGEKWFSYLF